MDSLTYLVEKLTHLQRKYAHSPRYCAFRMMITSAHATFMKNPYKITKFGAESSQNTASLGPTLVFDIKGGLGDFIIAINFIYCLSLYLNDCKIRFKIAYHDQEILDCFCQNLPQLIQTGHDIKKLKGNLLIEINRFPRILSGDIQALRLYSDKLGLLIDEWNKFFLHYRKFFDLMPQLDGWSNSLTLLSGQKSINRSDVNGLLKMGEEYLYPIPLSSEKEVLEKYQLSVRKYITIHRGKGITSKRTAQSKLWSVTKYNHLCRLLKEKYPEYCLVQLGCEAEDALVPTDKNLLGKLAVNELKVLLKNAALHIDCEGGLVHLRHALHGGISAVIFGPTSPDIYGYSENINVRSNACPGACEWLRNDWESSCVHRGEKFICLANLKPEEVFDTIHKNPKWRTDCA